MSRPVRSNFMRNWFAIEAIPIYAVIGLAVGGAGWYLARLATRPDVIWTKSNPQPWNTVKQTDNIKLMAVNQKFDKSALHLDMVMPLNSPQPNITLPPLSQIPDDVDDRPRPGDPLGNVGAFNLPELVFGAATLSNQYNSDGLLTSDIPLRTVRLALRYGMRAFDTSAYYGPSEIVLGAALNAISEEFPRSSYQLMTKCGRYGPLKENFDYSPDTIRKSVERSLERLHTDYLDVVYLHDVEFVAEAILPRPFGHHQTALSSEAEAYGLANGQESKVWGPGDQKIIDAMAELRNLQAEGKIKHVGITGYPLPTLLRISLLILHTPPYEPIDVLLSYSQSNLQNSAFYAYAPVFRQRAKINQLLAASPLNMGLLSPKPPSWHPAPEPLHQAVQAARGKCAEWPGGLVNVALGYSMRRKGDDDTIAAIPTVVGFSAPNEVHDSLRAWREVRAEKDVDERNRMENAVQDIFKDSGFYGWAWASPSEPI
ncbi:Aldo/keto reductase [Rickenella mellea]|uniref:Aldo/keto reductase n=1 Tax=Rickenella mellea TaxID=50990 RepID=A0A4R5XF77_9AGAM|nr:Aldo/keto reductase [Rickenella mellea]